MIKKVGIIIFILTTMISGYSEAKKINHSVYIWQKDWQSEIGESIGSIHSKIDNVTILAGNIEYSANKLSVSEVQVQWVELEKLENKINIAVRLNTRVKKLLLQNEYSKVLDAISFLVEKQEEKIQENKIKVVGIQFDYDCPTSKLKDYTELIRIARERFDGYEISITALPTWLGSKEFKYLAKVTDYYVLQLHSFEAPKTINDKRQIFLKDKAIGYVRSANKLKHPFSIALPTYGYEVGFDDQGKFLGLRAETEPIFWGGKATVVREHSSPQELLDFIGILSKNKLDNLIEIIWFRLPVKGDEFNWDIRTLITVINGKRPIRSLEAKLEEKGKGLFDVFIVNNGEENIFEPISLNISWDSETNYLYDINALYKASFASDKKGLLINGPAPKVGQTIFVGWLRMREEDKKTEPFLSEVIFNEK